MRSQLPSKIAAVLLLLFNLAIFWVLGFLGSLYLTGNSLDLKKILSFKNPEVLKEDSVFGGSLLFPETKPVEFSLDLPVLTYHYIRVPPNPEEDKLGYNLSTSPQNFQKQMDYLKEREYHTLSPNELYQALKDKKTLPQKSVLLTFDDGYRDFYKNAFPVLKELNLKATVFVVTGFVGDKAGRYLTWNQIKEMDKSGLITFGSHTEHHVDLTRETKAQQELAKSKEILEKNLGKEVMIFAYPGGKFDTQSVKLVSKSGYNLAFTTQIGTKMSFEDRFALPRVRISGGLSLKSFPEKLLPIKGTKNPKSQIPTSK